MTIKRLLLALMLCLGLLPLCARGEDALQTARYYAVTNGYDMPRQVQDRASELMQPVTLSCGPVSVTLAEVIYDGRWLYAAASVRPVDPDASLILPSGAGINDPVAGMYQENERDDPRTFYAAATEDHKALISVYAYPVEVSLTGSYTLDEFQRGDDVSVLFSAGQFPSEEEQVTIHWSIEIAEVDPIAGTRVKRYEETCPMEISVLAPLVKQRYQLSDSEGLPFAEADVVMSGLTCYIEPLWHQSGANQPYLIILYDMDGRMLPHGAPPSVDTFMLEDFPEQLIIEITDLEGDAPQERRTMTLLPGSP